MLVGDLIAELRGRGATLRVVDGSTLECATAQPLTEDERCLLMRYKPALVVQLAGSANTDRRGLATSAIRMHYRLRAEVDEGQCGAACAWLTSHPEEVTRLNTLRACIDEAARRYVAGEDAGEALAEALASDAEAWTEVLSDRRRLGLGS